MNLNKSLYRWIDQNRKMLTRYCGGNKDSYSRDILIRKHYILAL